MKPKVFIGSSSEGLPIAKAIFACLTDEPVQPRIWSHFLFEPGKYILETLEEEIKKFDFAILVASPDDILCKRDNISLTMRDNVLFELGLFTGVLGRRRVFLVCPKTTSIAIPSDLHGLIYLTYDNSEITGNLSETVAAVQQACLQITQTINNIISDITDYAKAIAGDWHIYIAGSKVTEPNGIMTFEPHSDHIKAECKLTEDSEGNKIDQTFYYFGTYNAPLLNLTFEEGDKGTHIRGVTALRLDTKKEKLHGYNLYWHNDKSRWRKQEFRLKRAGS